MIYVFHSIPQIYFIGKDLWINLDEFIQGLPKFVWDENTFQILYLIKQSNNYTPLAGR